MSNERERELIHSALQLLELCLDLLKQDYSVHYLEIFNLEVSISGIRDILNDIGGPNIGEKQT